MTQLDIWQQYVQTRDVSLRDRIIEQELELVGRIASRLKARLPNHIEYDDLVGFGVFGLLDAIERFDPAQGASFRTFASRRIEGAIIDGLRSMDWVPDTVRKKEKEIHRSMAVFYQKHGRMPSDNELVEVLGWSVDELERVVGELDLVHPLSLDSCVDDNSFTTLGETIEDDLARYGFEQLERDEMVSLLSSAIEMLDEREKYVLSLYYRDEMTLEEIGAVLGITRFRVSQIHKKCIMKIRAYILARAHLEDLDVIRESKEWLTAHVGLG